MTLASPIIRVYFGLEYSTTQYFTLDDDVKGEIDNSTYLIAGEDGEGIDITSDGYEVSIQRGRSRELDEFEVGMCQIMLRNFERTYDNLNTAGTFYGNLVPGKRVEVEMYGQPLFAGTIEDWDLDWSVDGDATATILAVDALGDLGLKEFDAWTTTASQTAGPRLTAVLDRPEVAFGSNRDLGTGQSTLQADNVTWGSNVLNYCQLVAKSDQGRFFASRENVLTFRDRHDLVGAASTVTFTDDGTGTVFHGVATQTGSELLFNRVGVDREGGTLQTVEDTASQADYGVRSLSLTGLLMDSDIQSESMAEYLCFIYKDPITRVSSVSVKLHDPQVLSYQGLLASLEIGDQVDIVWTPRGVGDPIEDTLVVEGVDHDISYNGGHLMTVHLGTQSQSGVFILDDDVWGVLDTGPGVLSF